MKSFLTLAVVSLLLGSANAFAAGALDLTIQSSGTTKVLHIDEVPSGYSGTITVNSVSQPLTITTTFNGFNVQVGSETSFIQAFRGTETTAYQGNLGSNSAQITADIRNNGRTVYDGTVGAFDDLSGKSDSSKLTLFWGKSKLTLNQGASSGSCSGEVRSQGTISHTLSCQSSGSLTDAFFTNPDQVVSLIINLLVR